MRIVITLGGSVIIRDHNPQLFQDYAEVLKSINEVHDLFVVVGGGKTARDYIGIARGVGASEALCDDVGIDVTRLNARLLTIALGENAYPRIPENFHQALEFATSGKMVVMGGTEPAHSTDAVGSILAEYVGADFLINVTSVDGLYDKDPKKYPDAKLFREVTPSQMMDCLADNEVKAGTYEFLDHTAIQIIKRSGIKTVILNGKNPENIKRALKDNIGTLIIPEY